MDGHPEGSDRGALTPEKRAGELASANAVLPRILRLVPDVSSMVHVGFESDAWVAEARQRGVTDVRAINGHELGVDRTFDLALCIEYAEHLPESQAASLVNGLARLAPVVAFSAAIPGQGGIGHLNEQWPAYWEERFANAGFRFVDALRRDLWREPGGPAYLAQNLFLAVDERRLGELSELARLAAERPGPALPVVHPDVFRSTISRLEEPGVRLATRALAAAIRRRASRR